MKRGHIGATDGSMVKKGDPITPVGKRWSRAWRARCSAGVNKEVAHGTHIGGHKPAFKKA